MFKKSEDVIYPVYGAGSIKAVYMETLGEKKIEYYQLDLYTSTVDISIPVEKAEELGLRYPMSKKALRAELSNMNKTVEITDTTLETLDEVTSAKIKSGDMKDAVDLLNLLTSLARKKAEESKNFSYTHSQRLETVVTFIKSEVILVLGESAVEKYEFPD